MGKAKKFPFILIAIPIVIVLLISIYGAVKFMGQGTIVANISGCKQMTSPYDVTTSQADSFTCQYDKCIVSGQLTCDVQTSLPQVTLRCGDGWFAWDQYNSGVLQYYALSGPSYSNAGAFTTIATCQNGYVIKQYSGYYFYGLPGATSLSVFSQKAPTDSKLIQLAPLNVYNGVDYSVRETTKSGSGYTCNWRLCNPADANDPYCDKWGSGTSSSNSWTGTSSDIYLTKGQSITFRPTDANNNPLPSAKKLITSINYDCTCLTSNNGGPECSINSMTCTPSYLFSSLTACYAVCSSCSYYNTNSYKCNPNYGADKLYQTCGTVSNSCNAFNSPVYTCTGSKVCQMINGQGTCACPSVPACALGAWQCSPDGKQYQVCHADANGCPTWNNDWQYCPQGTLSSGSQCSSTAKSCIPNNECSFGQTSCVSTTQIQECKAETLANGATAYYNTIRNCGQTSTEPTYCIHDTDGTDKCGCANENCKVNGSISCLNGNVMQCRKGTSGCLGIQQIKTGNCCMSNSDCSIGKTCITNQCTSGDNYCTTDSDCSTKHLGQVCDQSTASCTCPTTGDYCTSAQKGATKCLTQTNLQVCDHDSISSCYKWATIATCTQPNICISGTTAKCDIPGSVYLTGDTLFPLNSPIDVTAHVKSGSAITNSQLITMRLYDSNNNPIGSTFPCYLTAQSDGSYSCTATYSGISQAGKYIVKATTTLSGVDVTANETINAFIGATVGIISPSVIYTHEPGIAYLKVVDANGNIVTTVTGWTVSVSVSGQPMLYNLQPQSDGSTKLTYGNGGASNPIGIAGNLMITATPTVTNLAPIAGSINCNDATKQCVNVNTPILTVTNDMPPSTTATNPIYHIYVRGSDNNPDNQAAYINVPANSITVEVKSPDGTKSYPSVSGTNGQYTFSPSLTYGGGTTNYQFTITVSYSTWPQDVKNYNLNVESSTIQPVSGTDWNLYILIGVIVVLVIVVFVVVLRRKKK